MVHAICYVFQEMNGTKQIYHQFLAAVEPMTDDVGCGFARMLVSQGCSMFEPEMVLRRK